jgi:uncharacterized protein (TIRG00374 family)
MSVSRYSRGRVALIVVALLSLAGFTALTWPTLQDLWTRMSTGLDATDWAVLGLAAVVQLGGHLLRAARTKVPIDNVRRGSLAGQFRHLSIGYLFNLVWPLRVGEVVRAYLVAKTLRISFLYTLLAVVLERLIDVVLVSGAFLVFLAIVGGPVAGVVPAAAAIALVAVGAASLVTDLNSDRSTTRGFATAKRPAYFQSVEYEMRLLDRYDGVALTDGTELIF